MLKQAVRRLRFISLAGSILIVVPWFLINLIEGEFLDEFSRIEDWLPASVLLVSSLTVYLLTRLARVSTSMLLTAGLVFQVLVSYGLAIMSLWGQFKEVPAGFIDPDRVGLTGVAVWMFAYTVLVPNRPWKALLALLGSSSATPVVFSLMIHTGEAPVVSPWLFFLTFVFPYLVVTVLAYISTWIIFSLGRELKHARELGSYRLEKLLGKGGMGEVWSAKHSMLARPAAVKLIRQDTIGANPASIATAIDRFEREAQVTAGLQSPHTVQLYDYGTSDDNTLYYVMELLDGIDLETLVQQYGPVAPERTVYILLQVCHSLADAHHQGLVHRDIKPSNIFLSTKGLDHDSVKVLDFGLVAVNSAESADDQRLTVEGVIAGTPAYLAPEIAKGSDADTRADLYALGCVAYWLLSGKLVFEADSPVGLLLAHAGKEPIPPSRHSELEIPDSLDRIVLACLQKDPGQRPQSAGELADRLRACDLPQPWTNERARNWWQKYVPGKKNG
jgi:serine/threonine-protein kinase